jgi:hypothetical protein
LEGILAEEVTAPMPSLDGGEALLSIEGVTRSALIRIDPLAQKWRD